MKVAVFSDVQGNLPALQEVCARLDAWQPDLVVMAGDLVSRGPDSLGCLRLFDARRRQQGWLPVQGNHEAWVLRCGREAPRSPGDAAIRRIADWTWRQLAPCDAALRHWPDHLCFDAPVPGHWVHITHGSLTGHRDGISPLTPNAALAGKLPLGVALFVCGHTHKVDRRFTQGMEVFNVGSAGSPFDRDPRGSFGKFVFRGGRWSGTIERFIYDRAQTERDFHTSGFLDEGGPLARLIFAEWRRATVLTAGWRRRYEQAVLDGAIDLHTSIEAYLASIGERDSRAR